MESQNLLVSDLDGTLLGDEAALEEFARWYQPRREILKLVYTSGRLFASMLESVDTTPLPNPVAMISGVGTEIRLHETGEPLERWPESSDYWCRDEIEHALRAHFPELELQPQQFQSTHKLSFFAHDIGEEQLTRVQHSLTKAGFRINLVYSSRRDLDILPAGVDKGSSAAFVAEHLGIARENVIVSGDSGNDAALFAQGFRGIVVANAQPELKALGGPAIYHARRSFAGGVLEGLLHWNVARCARA